ncbi:hypothetical protein CCM_03897 [Cordyceps militaris CM01]|uniref:Uncharacterized protein n=1 Tax=Cordyceps militaris (strain CM01) TaxID=983644 RepID=G3JCZ6_CORMM|nr:uncharacterized protein CCM_03897 [Cordyceps militaris CM01]EGX92524.1 hypothetical protein CCM_03897 [Cordyceps militaris CM01]
MCTRGVHSVIALMNCRGTLVVLGTSTMAQLLWAPPEFFPPAMSLHRTHPPPYPAPPPLSSTVNKTLVIGIGSVEIPVKLGLLGPFPFDRDEA